MTTGNSTGGFEIPSPFQLFTQYDVDGSGGILKPEFRRMLEDLDGFSDVPAKEAEEYVDQEFDSADLNHDGMLSVDEFFRYYYSDLCFKFPVGRDGFNPGPGQEAQNCCAGADLYNIFVKYCSFGKSRRSEEMECCQFARLCKESNLLNTRCTRAAVDVIFARARAERMVVKDLGASKLQYQQFLHALMLVGEKRKTGFMEVVSCILKAISAKPTASMADLLLFKNMGAFMDDEFLERPKGLPPAAHHGASVITNAEDEKIRMLQSMQDKRTACSARETMRRPWTAPVGNSSEGPLPPQPDTPLSPSPGVHPQQDGQDPALANSRSAPASTSRAAGGQPPSGHPDDLAENAGSGAVASTQPSMDPKYVAMLQNSMLSDEQRGKWGLAWNQDDRTQLLGSKLGQTALTDVAVMHKVENVAYLKCVADELLSDMDKIRFNKVMRDAQLVDQQGAMTPGHVDHIFSRVKPGSKPVINFYQFMEGLRHVAVLKRVSLNEVMERVVVVGKPA